ncbi:MAG: glycosyltransferase family 4 protein [Bacteroidota bacterium]
MKPDSNIGCYYHIPFVYNGNKIKLPGYYGVFIDSLASNCGTFYLVAHEAREHEKSEADYELKSTNIILISLGKKTAAWHRTLFHRKLLSDLADKLINCSHLIVRSPSPLAPYFSKYSGACKVVFMVVGDYAESVEQSNAKTFRERIINIYLRFNDYQFRKQMKVTDVMVNSPVLYKKYQLISKSIHQIKTTTLSKADFHKKEDTCNGEQVHLLYTGRIDPLKGLFELIEAFAILKKSYAHLILNIVGWESSPEKPVEMSLKNLALSLGVNDDVIFHGKKQIGQELNQVYRQADIYIIPSYEEGFPRTIWEAMANSLPVIATNVGAIPHYLTHRKDALIIEPKKVEQIVGSITELMSNQTLRKKLIQGGQMLAENNTLEYQTNNILNILNKLN